MAHSLHRARSLFASALRRLDQQGQTTATMKSQGGELAGILLPSSAKRRLEQWRVIDLSDESKQSVEQHGLGYASPVDS